MTQRILLLSDSHEHTMMLKRSLGDDAFNIDSNPAATDELCMLAINSRPDLIVIIMDRINVETINNIHQLMQKNPTTIILFVNSGDEKSATAATQAGVSAYVIDGLRENRVKPILTAAVARFMETQKLRQDLSKAQTDLKHRKLIERAKGLLMKQRGCSEDEAYSALRTLAMKQNKHLSEIAESVISTASLMN